MPRSSRNSYNIPKGDVLGLVLRSTGQGVRQDKLLDMRVASDARSIRDIGALDGNLLQSANSPTKDQQLRTDPKGISSEPPNKFSEAPNRLKTPKP
jgi:hypothetical protein